MSNQNYEKANWIRQAQLANGTIVSVSERSGIVKIELPKSGRRAPVLYSDEIMALLACGTELQRYLQDHDDVVFSKEQAVDATQVKREQSKAAGNAAAGLMKLGFTKEEIVTILANKAG